MKLEPGKYYRTRDGRKAFVESVVEGDLYACFGCISYKPTSWTKDGSYLSYVEGGCDLIEEWKECSEPEVYEFECLWEEEADASLVYPVAEDAVDKVFSKLIGKRTKVKIEVID